MTAQWVVALCLAFAACASQAIEVRSSALYEASFRARVVKGPTLEKYPQLSDLVGLLVSHYNSTKIPFASFNWAFREVANGKVIPRANMAASPTILFHGDWRDFTIRFWTPENATWFALTASGAEIDGLELREVAPARVLNINERLDANDEFTPGWQLAGPAQFKRDKNGVKYIFAEEGRVSSDLFAVKPLSRVKVLLRGTMPRYALENAHFTASVYFFEAYHEASSEKTAAKFRAARKVRITGKEGEASYIYSVPEKARWARLVASGGNIYECSATELQADE
jgi:hypothetical protein